MTIAAVLLACGDAGPLRARRRRLAAIARGAANAGVDELIAVVDDAALAEALPGAATVLLDEAVPSSTAGGARVAVDWSTRAGHEAIVVGLVADGDEMVLAAPGAWRAVTEARSAPIVLGTFGGRFVGLARLDVLAWGLLPLEGSFESALRSHGGLVADLELVHAIDQSHPRLEASGTSGAFVATEADRVAVEDLLGRAPLGRFRVAVRRVSGEPVVIENAPFLADGTPMPTTFWLVGARECELVGRLEAAGGVRAAEAAVDPDELAAAHASYAAHRDALIAPDHLGPRPSGGVGGTRRGVKCLHAHLAWYLAGGPDPVGRHAAFALGADLEGAVAAIDCGTNSTRLLILDRSGAPLVRETTITRLGEGVDETGSLAEAAIERTLAVLGGYRSVMDQNGVVRLRCAATSAVRDATNADALLGPIAELLGVEAELLSGDEEGRTAYAGATVDLDEADGPFLVVDLGGGSTELVTRQAHQTELVSLSMGCVRVRERFLASDPPRPDEIAAARDYVRVLVSDALLAHRAFATARTMVGVAGTVSTLALLASGATEYVSGAAHHLPLSRRDVARLLDELGALPLTARQKVPGIEHGRADVIVAGALVLDELMGGLGYDELVCSESDILDGLAFSLLGTRS